MLNPSSSGDSESRALIRPKEPAGAGALGWRLLAGSCGIRRALCALLVVAALLSSSGCIFVEDDDRGYGRLLFSWSLRDLSTGNTVACRLDERVELGIGSVVESYDCSLGTVTSGLLREGDYLAELDLVDSLGVESAVELEVSVFEGATTDIGHITFVVAD
ncbi:MAG: hypothetical protein V2A73_22875 [Pseudomonadota bacterium]